MLHHPTIKHPKTLLCSLMALALFCSCSTYKNVPYFKDFPDTARAVIQKSPYHDLVIHTDDLVNINIQTIDPAANQIFNQNIQSPLAQTLAITGTMGASSSQTSFTYLVDKGGYVMLPILGKIKIEGLTSSEARDTIQQKASIYYKDPTVNVRFANLKVTVLGEVSRPGTYTLPNEKNTIFDALGLSGDLTIFGKRENILLIRDSADQEKLIRFSLNEKDIIHKDFFYLRQNDVFYVEPNKAKIASLDAVKTRNYTIIASVLSVLVILATRIN
jgi:polysaccharide export outer membrane protein